MQLCVETTMRMQPLLHAIESIYDAALDGRRWPRTAEAISRAIGGLPVNLIVNDVKTGATPLWASTGVDTSAVQRFLRNYATADLNPALPLALTIPIGRSVNLIERVGEKRYTASAYYQDVERPFAARTYRNTVAVRDNTLFAGVGVFAPTGFRAPTRRETDALETVTRHFGRSMKLAVQLGEAQAESRDLEAILDRLSTAVFVADASGRVIRRNRAAAAILDRADGLRIAAGRLRASDLREDRALAAALAARRDASIRISRRLGRPPYVLRVCELPAVIAGRAFRTAVFVGYPDQAEPSVESLVSAFGLTVAEARVAVAVIRERGLAAAARSLGLSVNTVKSMLQRTFEKTGTRTQSELARLLITTAAQTRDG
jgi:DNA-binding CsgD family transcriptional regulator